MANAVSFLGAIYLGVVSLCRHFTRSGEEDEKKKYRFDKQGARRGTQKDTTILKWLTRGALVFTIPLIALAAGMRIWLVTAGGRGLRGSAMTTAGLAFLSLWTTLLVGRVWHQANKDAIEKSRLADEEPKMMTWKTWFGLRYTRLGRFIRAILSSRFRNIVAGLFFFTLHLGITVSSRV